MSMNMPMVADPAYNAFAQMAGNQMDAQLAYRMDEMNNY